MSLPRVLLLPQKSKDAMGLQADRVAKPGSLLVRASLSLAVAACAIGQSAPAFAICGTLGSALAYPLYGSSTLAVGSSTVSNGTNSYSITGSGRAVNQNSGAELTPSPTPTLPSLSPATFPTNGSSTNTSATSITPGSYNQVTISGTTTFAAGIYYINTLTLSSGQTVTFGAGTYYIGTLTMQDNDTINVASGTVELNIGSSLSIHDHDSLNAGGNPAALLIFMYPGASATIHDNFTFAGLLYGPGDTMVIHDSASISGALIGASVTFKDSGNVTYSPAVASALQSVSTCGLGSIDHYELSLPSTGVTCTPVTATVTACNDSTNPCTNTSTSLAGQTATLSTSAGALGATTVTFGATGTASTTLSNPSAANGSGATVTLAGESTSPANSNKCCSNGTSCSVANSCPITFNTAGFIFSASLNGASATLPTQTAGTNSGTYYLRAVKTNTTTQACAAALSGANAVNWAYQCNNPTTCSAGNLMSINGGTATAIAGNPNSAVSTYTSVAMTFDANGNAPFSFTYGDVGQTTLWVNKTVNGAALSGASNALVTKPAGFTLSGIQQTASPNLANPAASSAAGPVFISGGANFSATVTAVTSGGAATRNYGQETSPQGVTLAANLVLPAAGHAAALNNASAFGSFSGGVASGTTFNWPEVGIITLTPSVSSYLGAGAVTGTTTGNVGRFTPNAFATAVNTPVFGTACGSGGFGYVGQPFIYTVAPVITVTAQAVGGSTTQNYTGSFMRLSNTSLSGRTYTPTPASPALALSGLPPTTSDPAITDLGAGQANLVFSAGSGISFARSSAIPPFSGNIALSINVIDLDGVTATNPVTAGAGSGIAFSTGATQRYGRLAVRNALGSELLDLPMSLTTQYYLSTTQGFTTNANDSCTAAPAIVFSAYQANLAAGETCVRDTGSPGVSGSGCAAAAAPSLQYSATASAGGFNLILAAPGAGNSGALNVTATAPTWLQYLWNASSGLATSPSGMATFGEFPGSVSRVYQREVY